MNSPISRHLSSIALERGLRIMFRQLPCGLWRCVAIHTTRTREIWTGSLVEAFRIAKGTL